MKICHRLKYHVQPLLVPSKTEIRNFSRSHFIMRKCDKFSSYILRISWPSTNSNYDIFCSDYCLGKQEDVLI